MAGNDYAYFVDEQRAAKSKRLDTGNELLDLPPVVCASVSRVCFDLVDWLGEKLHEHLRCRCGRRRTPAAG